jgi:class 3 adenylate cyclase/tetratricopeptide (TPR) repeat protein
MNIAPSVHQEVHSTQRRHLTVMFCDLVDSVSLAESLDPEDMAEVFRVFRDCYATAIEAGGGFVAKYMGDGILAYFGFPLAHEDDAERAIHVALTLVAQTPALRTVSDRPLAARIGIATGLVVVGRLVGTRAVEEQAIVGATPNLAARLQAAAGPNEVYVSNATRRLAAGLFDYEELGRLPLKGVRLNEPVWRVTGPKAAPDRFRARQSTRRTPMLGRQAELGRLLEHWRLGQAGHAQFVGVVGEAGIGKSRLIDEFHRQIAVREPHIWLEGAGAQIFRHTPFHAIGQAIHRRLAGGRTLTVEERLRRLQTSLKSAGVETEEALDLIAELIDPTSPDATLTEQRWRSLVGALGDWLVKSAERWPTALVVEDLQWVDPSTLEFLQSLVRRAPDCRLLVLYTARPESADWWPIGGPHAQISLGRLDRESVRNLVVASAPRRLASDLLERMVARADGVPLFAEELARLSGQSDGAEGDIPSALSDLLMARLDQLGPAKLVAQIASVLGGDIPRSLLTAVAGLDEDALQTAIDRLLAADVLSALRGDGETAYRFRHALIEAAAYETLLRPMRRTLHRQAAFALMEHFADSADRWPEVLAQHWLRAGEQREAASAWRKAARLACERHAFREAQNACEEGLAILRSLGASTELEADELSLQTLLAEAARGTEGYASPRALAAMERATELTGPRGGAAERLRRAFGEWAAQSSLGAYPESAGPAEEFVQLAKADGGIPMLGLACTVQLTSRYRIGDILGAEEAYQVGGEYLQHPDFLKQAGAAAQAFGSAAIVAWLLGHHEEAARRNELNLTVSRVSGNPYDRAFSHHAAAGFALLASMPKDAEAYANEAMRVSEENGYLAFASAARIMLGRARFSLGDPAQGAALMHASLRGPGAPANRNSMTMYLTWLAEAQSEAGALDLAGETLEQALSVNPRELFFRPETLRVRGDRHRALGQIAESRSDYLAALGLARSIGAAVLVQRATASLAGLEHSLESGRVNSARYH